MYAWLSPINPTRRRAAQIEQIKEWMLCSVPDQLWIDLKDKNLLKESAPTPTAFK